MSSAAWVPVSLYINICTSFFSQAQIDLGAVSVNVFSYTFTYDDGSGSPPTFVVPSANCTGGVCQHVFSVPTSSVPPSYTVSVTATNVVGKGPASISQPISEQ